MLRKSGKVTSIQGCLAACLCLLPLLMAVPGTAAATPGATSRALFSPPGGDSASPTISKVDPASAGPGSNIILTITGQNFATNATIAFSNPKITVVTTTVKSKSKITAHVQIAADAATGSTGLFVVNPDQSEVEGSFEVGGAAVNTAPSTPAATAAAPSAKSSATKTGGKTVSFDVFNVADVLNVIKTRSQVHGTLSVSQGMLTYSENGAKVFSVPVSEVQEVAPNVFLGLDTGTFHVILTTGKRYNFTAATLVPADTQKIETQLRAALK